MSTLSTAQWFRSLWVMLACACGAAGLLSMPASAQTDDSIVAIQSQISQGDDSAWVGQTVIVEGIVTGIYHSLFFIQEAAGGPWSGIAVYAPDHNTALGDRVRITGEVSEYYDLTQIEPAAIEVLSSDNPLPDPVDLTVQEAVGEQWEGVLVRIPTLTVISPPNQFGEWLIGDATGTMLVDDKGVFYEAKAGESIPAITAVVDHAFGTYRLIPRRLDDIGGTGEPPAAWTAIFTIQGEARASTFADQRVDTVGRVTAVAAEGFYLQDANGDDNPLTSDGIYVYTGTRPDVESGACVLVRQGLVTEFYGKTELSRVQAIQPVDLCAGQSVRPVVVPLPALNSDPAAELEPFEGMLVALAAFTATVQGPTKRFVNGDVELSVIAEQFTHYLPGKRVYQSETGDQAALIFLSNGLGAELPDAAWGDQITIEPVEAGQPVLAILDFNFGKYQVLLLPDQPIVVMARNDRLDQATAPGSDEFTVCSFNLAGMGQGSAQYPDGEAYAAQLYKRALVIAETLHGCTVIGLQETGTPADAENLAALLAETFGLDYSAVAIEGPNTVNEEYPLTLSLLARADQVEILHAESIQGCSPEDYGVLRLGEPCAPDLYPLFDRPPLIVELAVSGSWEEPYLLTVVNNHWKSKVDDETRNLRQRTAQAERVALWVQEQLDVDPDAQIVVLGDLNDFYQSRPMLALQQGTTPNLFQSFDVLPALDRYTYIFNGASQALDYILYTPGIRAEFAGIEPVHINADYPVPVTVQMTSTLRSSDHDPVQLTIRPQGAGWIGGNVSIPGMLVSLRDSSGSGVGATLTDSAGEFRFWGLAPGRYHLVFKPPASVSIRQIERALQVRPGAGLYLQPAVQTEQTTLGISSILLGAGLGIAAEDILAAPSARQP